MKTKTKPLALLAGYAARQRGRIAFLTLTFIFGSALMILAPQALSRFIDSVHEGSSTGGVLAAIGAYLALTLAQVGITALLNVQLTSIGQLITNDYRRDVLKKYLELDSQTLSGWTSGEAMTRIDEDVEGLFKYYYVLFYKLTGSALVLIAILATLAVQSLWLAMALMAAAVLFILIFKAIQDRGIAKYVKSSRATAEFNGSMKELLSNAAALRALGAEDFGSAVMGRAMRKRYGENLPASLMYGNLWMAATLMQFTVVGAGLLFAASLWDSGTITLGMAYMIYTYAELVTDPLQDFRDHMGSMQDSRAGILRTQALMELQGAEHGGTAKLRDEAPALDVEGLSFAYTDGAEVLKNVSLHIPAGGSLGIMGETGCGKTTLMGCVAGMNKYTSGSIRLGGVELRELSQESLRRSVAYCAQRVQLLHATLRDNICLFDEEIKDAEIYAAVEALGLSQWLSGFPQGLDTLLELGEENLSVGEARLVALVRLALRKPRLVLLDEISAGLDPQTERYVTVAVRALCRGRTVLAIAHNEAALEWMDRIEYLRDGAFDAAAREGSAV